MNAETQPFISYIVVTHNRRRFLDEALTSIYCQNVSNFEVIIVDNASTDGTDEYVKSHYPRSKYFRSATNLGVAGGRNFGVGKANGDIGIFIDDDAVFRSTNGTSTIVERFQKNPQLAVLSATIINQYTGQEERESIPHRQKLRQDVDYRCAYFCGCCFAVKLDSFREIGGFWDWLVYCGEELDFSYQLLERGQQIEHSAEVVVIHARTPQARPSGQYYYYYARNRPLIALRHLGVAQALSTACLWWLYLLPKAIVSNNVAYLARGIRDCLTHAMTIWRDATPVSRQTVADIKRLHGRIWY